MKIAIVGESASNPSGFGQQARMLAEGFQTRGHEATIVCGIGSQAQLPHIQEWRTAKVTDVEEVDKTLHAIEPDVVICFWHTQMIQQLTMLRSAPANCPVLYWLPYEASTLPEGIDAFFKKIPENYVVHLSEFAKKLWHKKINSDVVIPHGVDLELFKPVSSKDVQVSLRRKWAERLRFPLFADSFVVLNVDRNIWHKRWDATFDFIRKLTDRTGLTVQLIAHTKKKETMTGPVAGFDLEELEKAYGLEGKVAYTEFDWDRGFSREDLAEIYQFADLRITTSQGEGFGVPTIEAAACNCPQIVNNTTTMPELLGPDALDCLVTPAMKEFKVQALYEVPHVDAMVDQAIEFIENPATQDLVTKQCRQHVLENFDSRKVVDIWLYHLETIVKGPVNKNGRATQFHWGYSYQDIVEGEFGELAQIISKLDHEARILDIGAFDGRFVDTCLQLGHNVIGIEPDAAGIGSATVRSQRYIINQPIENPWPDQNVAVITDCLGRWDRSQVISILDRASLFDWLCLRMVPLYSWGEPIKDLNWVTDYLESKKATRRHDMEELIIKQFVKTFTYQIWQRGTDTSNVPKAILSP